MTSSIVSTIAHTIASTQVQLTIQQVKEHHLQQALKSSRKSVELILISD